MKIQHPNAKINEETLKSFNNVDLSKVKGSATEIFTTNFEKFNNCRTFEDVVALCHELLDNAGLDSNWTRKFFYQLDQIKARNPNPRRAFEQAMLYMNNARQRGMGLGMGRGSSRFYEGEEVDESMDDNQKEEFKKKLRAGKVEFKYKKKDGSERKAVGTMDPKLMDLPENKTQSDVDGAEKKKTRKLPADSVFYYDIEAKGFRSFKMENFIGYV